MNDNVRRLSALLRWARDSDLSFAASRDTLANYLDDAGVFAPPAEAALSEGRVVETTEALMPAEIDPDSEAAAQWFSEQPAVLVRHYEWPEPPPTCPDCAAGKHTICNRAALGWDDKIVPCRCGHAGP